jgi:hypothetical protein
MNSLPLVRHELNRDLRIKRVLIGVVAVVAIGLTVVIVALSTSSGTGAGAGAAQPTADGGQTLMHFYGNGTPPSTRPAPPQTPSRPAPSRHFYGQQP